jgi:hypothetical protein
MKSGDTKCSVSRAAILFLKPQCLGYIVLKLTHYCEGNERLRRFLTETSIQEKITLDNDVTIVIGLRRQSVTALSSLAKAALRLSYQ